MLGGNPTDIITRPQRIDAVTPANVLETLKRYLPLNRYTVVTLVPEKDGSSRVALIVLRDARCYVSRLLPTTTISGWWSEPKRSAASGRPISLIGKPRKDVIQFRADHSSAPRRARRRPGVGQDSSQCLHGRLVVSPGRVQVAGHDNRQVRLAGEGGQRRPDVAWPRQVLCASARPGFRNARFTTRMLQDSADAASAGGVASSAIRRCRSNGSSRTTRSRQRFGRKDGVAAILARRAVAHRRRVEQLELQRLRQLHDDRPRRSADRVAEDSSPVALAAGTVRSVAVDLLQEQHEALRSALPP